MRERQAVRLVQVQQEREIRAREDALGHVDGARGYEEPATRFGILDVLLDLPPAGVQVIWREPLQAYISDLHARRRQVEQDVEDAEASRRFPSSCACSLRRGRERRRGHLHGLGSRVPAGPVQAGPLAVHISDLHARRRQVEQDVEDAEASRRFLVAARAVDMRRWWSPRRVHSCGRRRGNSRRPRTARRRTAWGGSTTPVAPKPKRKRPSRAAAAFIDEEDIANRRVSRQPASH
jgi:hypothetical protein